MLVYLNHIMFDSNYTLMKNILLHIIKLLKPLMLDKFHLRKIKLNIVLEGERDLIEILNSYYK